MVTIEDKSETITQFLGSELNTTVSEFVTNTGWELDPGLVERILTQDLTAEDTEYFNTNLSNLEHKKDNRTAIEYGTELVINWLLEDILFEVLNRDPDISVQRSGEDAKREFLENTTADEDLEIRFNENTYNLEVTAGYTGFWKRSGLIDLRDQKYTHLQKSTNGFLLGIELSDNTIFIEHPNKMHADYTDNHPYWEKPAYRIDKNSVQFTEFNNLDTEFKKKALIHTM